MKIRCGFVSNSSSSSYLCLISNETIICDQNGYWDDNLVECENYHVFKPEFMVWPAKISTKDKIAVLTCIKEGVSVYTSSKELKEFVNLLSKKGTRITGKMFDENVEHVKAILKNDNVFEGKINDIPACFCPVCNFTHAPRSQATEYMIRRHYGGDEKKLFEEILDKFDSYDELLEYVNG